MKILQFQWTFNVLGFLYIIQSLKEDFLKRYPRTLFEALLQINSYTDFYSFSRINKVQSVSTLATTAKSLQSCPTLCDPKDSSPPGSPVPGILQARTLEWVAILKLLEKNRSITLFDIILAISFWICFLRKRKQKQK